MNLEEFDLIVMNFYEYDSKHCSWCGGYNDAVRELSSRVEEFFKKKEVACESKTSRHKSR